MAIRSAKITDWRRISDLLGELGYPNTESFIQNKIARLLSHPDEDLLVYESDGKVVALISMHYIPQIALEGDFARISYFVVEDAVRDQGIGRKIEARITELARERKCDRIEVHCHSRRTNAHRFYQRQGYVESPKYFIKQLNN